MSVSIRGTEAAAGEGECLHPQCMTTRIDREPLLVKGRTIDQAEMQSGQLHPEQDRLMVHR